MASESPHAMTTSLLEKFKLGLGMHADAMPMLNKLFRTQVITPALSMADGRGTYVTLAPDYFDTHADDEISLAASDANQVYQAYVNKEGGTLKEARKLSLEAINKWLKNNEVKVFASRSPIPYVGGAAVVKVKALHNRGGQVIVSTNNAIRRFEGDFDADALQVQFLPAELTEEIETYLANASNRMPAISLPSLKDKIDLSKIENVRLLAERFQAGARAIGQIASIQNTFGQLNHSFENIALADGTFIKLHGLQDQVPFNEMDDSMTLENQLRIWIQAAADNGKHLLLHKWGYTREKLIGRLFYIADKDGNWISEIPADNEAMSTILKIVVGQHSHSRYIRSGKTPYYSHSVNTILKSSKLYLDYVNDRRGTLMEKIEGNKDIAPLVLDMAFNDGIAPLEEVAIALAEGWYGNEVTGLEGSAEPNKISPVEYEQGVYDSVHLQTMADIEVERDELMQEAIDEQRAISDALGEELTDERILLMVRNGMKFGNTMWNQQGEGENLIGEGFSSIMDKMGNDDMSNNSWDYNPDLIRFTSYWGDIFDDLNPVEKFSATLAFLRGFAQVDKEGNLMYTNLRNVLPPVSTKEKHTVLEPGLVEKYLDMYNEKLRNIKERSATAKRIAYDPQERIVKRLCK